MIRKFMLIHARGSRQCVVVWVRARVRRILSFRAKVPLDQRTQALKDTDRFHGSILIRKGATTMCRVWIRVEVAAKFIPSRQPALGRCGLRRLRRLGRVSVQPTDTPGAIAVRGGNVHRPLGSWLAVDGLQF